MVFLTAGFFLCVNALPPKLFYQGKLINGLRAAESDSFVW